MYRIVLLLGFAGLALAIFSLVSGQENTPAPQPPESTPAPGEVYVSSLPDYGAAPELSNNTWLNSDQPLRLSRLAGQVVLLEMWTYGCYNCVNTLPSMRAWHETYADQGLVVIGNHYPEFSFEADLARVREALVALEVTYPVAQDNNRETWSAYGNRYWPTIYLIDKNGHLRYRHIGEGAYDATEAAIRDLLMETYSPPAQAATPEALPFIKPTTGANVRSGPGTDQTLLGIVTENESFVLLGEENDWYAIEYNGSTGYVFAELMTAGVLE